jgi:hypothetical protein
MTAAPRTSRKLAPICDQLHDLKSGGARVRLNAARPDSVVVPAGTIAPCILRRYTSLSSICRNQNVTSRPVSSRPP